MGRARSTSVVLASASPQRRAILARLGVAFEVRPSDVDELASGEPHAVARENALRKARAVAADLDASSPGGSSSAWTRSSRSTAPSTASRPTPTRPSETLAALSAATHDVVSGLALIEGGTVEVATAVTRVTFRRLDAGLIAWYVGLGEWEGRAGGYAIQEAGGALVRSIDGDYLNVVGLPVALLLDRRPDLLA